VKVHESLVKEDKLYLQSYFDLILNPFIIRTSGLRYLEKAVCENDRVLICGPKGVGKSFSLLFIACTVKKLFIHISSLTYSLVLPRVKLLEERCGKILLLITGAWCHFSYYRTEESWYIR